MILDLRLSSPLSFRAPDVDLLHEFCIAVSGNDLEITNNGILWKPIVDVQDLPIACIDFNPRDLNPPHVHPRATKVFFLAQGTLIVGFIYTASKKSLFSKTIYFGDLFVFARELPHFLFNPNKSNTTLTIFGLNRKNLERSELDVTFFASTLPHPYSHIKNSSASTIILSASSAKTTVTSSTTKNHKNFQQKAHSNFL
ncbi:hypothetical protein KP509_08G020600 [Ceratopteris richardii]|uniref:Germin-like protein n=1 Tax=Ceratopteris richardii TaxID=49495 RepID=A0A8T2UAW7_CERRI|nr:hypothetical protein KP509_08G020600 [Ceratopteris richardii]